MISILRQRSIKHLYRKIVELKYDFQSEADRSEYYFGYGANLSLERFTSRKMNVEEIGNAKLENYKIEFTLGNEYRGKGYAGVTPSEERSFSQDYINFLKQHPYSEKFEIDHGFSLLFYGERRFLEKELEAVYRVHDKIREKLCNLI